MKQHISAEKLRFDARRTDSTPALRCSFFNQTAQFHESPVRKLLIGLLMVISLISPLALVQDVAAVDVVNPVCNNTNAAERPRFCDPSVPNEDPLVGPNGVLTTTVHILSLIVGVASVIVIVISGLRFAVAAGDANTISAARRTLLFAVVGVAVAAIAQLLVVFVLKKL